MKIISLTAENIKRLTAVQITPDGNMVQITGANGQGKTSVLDSIWWALAGAANIQDKPLHDDEEEGFIELDLGEYIVTRTFKRREEGNITTSLTVANADGAKFTSGQTMLDGFLGSLSFDPLEFKRMKPREQYDALKRFVPDVDFVEIEAEQKADFDARTELNRRAKEQRAAAEVIILPDDTPTEIVSIDGLMEEFNDAAEWNRGVDRQISSRADFSSEMETLRTAITDKETQVASLKKQLTELEEGLEQDRADLAKSETDLEEMPAPPDYRDVEEIRERMRTANDTNEQVRLYQQRREHEEKADEAEADAQILTDRMTERTATLNAAIEAANMPVEGLGLAEGQITYNGLPFDQASDAEQLRVSCAIAMRDNHKLKVIRVRDGSLLDDESLAMLAAMADDTGYQVWLERVETSGDVGFVIEDGHLKGQDGTAKGRAKPKAKEKTS